MGKFLKQGKVVVMLNGRYAGRKAVILKNYDEGTSQRGYGHCLVAGVDRYPRAVNASMGAKRLAKRSKLKPFLKVVNFTHVMPTRYTVEVDTKVLPADFFDKKDNAPNPEAKKKAIKSVKGVFEEKYKTGKNAWFFQKLRF